MKDGTTKSAPSDSPGELQERDEAAPQFSLIDLREQEHTKAGDGESGFSELGGNLLLRVHGRNCRFERPEEKPQPVSERAEHRHQGRP